MTYHVQGWLNGEKIKLTRIEEKTFVTIRLCYDSNKVVGLCRKQRLRPEQFWLPSEDIALYFQ